MSNVRQIVLETLGHRGPLPIEEIAGAANLSKVATRYHLSLLARDGLIVLHSTAPHGVGRPRVVYALAERAYEHLPKQYHWLAEQLLDGITTTVGDKETRTMLRRAGRRIASSAPTLRSGAGVQARLNRAVRFLSTSGYLAHWEKSHDGFRFHVCNCPYRQVAQAHREVCAMDVAMIGALLDVPAKMTRCIAGRDATCQFSILRRK